ncbi:MAG: thioredoxin [Clostridia bacterium]|nr:thioredoxin [Clostridia bacterium]
MKVIKLTKDNFNEEVMKAGMPVLIDFYADWCGPCRMLSPVIEELAEERDDIKVCKVNVDDEPELAATFEVSVIPTLAAMKDGALIGKSTGVVGKQSILGLLKIN